MENGKFVSYLRVSTVRQEASGLGLEAQRAAVAGFFNGGDWALVQEVLEVESGKRNDRPALATALKLCRKHRATLVIAKLARPQRPLHIRVDGIWCGVPGRGHAEREPLRRSHPGGSRGAGSRGHKQANEGGSRCS